MRILKVNGHYFAFANLTDNSRKLEVGNKYTVNFDPHKRTNEAWNAVVVENLPIPLFATTTLLCSSRARWVRPQGRSITFTLILR